MKKIYSIALVTFVVIFGVAASFMLVAKEQFPFAALHEPPEMSKVDPRKPLESQVRNIEIGARAFEIPIMFIDGHPDSRVTQESLLLEVIWPEMLSIWQLKEKAEYDEIRLKQHRLGWVLLESATANSSLDVQIENRRTGLTKEARQPDVYGLEKYLWYHGDAASPKLWSEFYILRNENGHAVVTIDCVIGKFPQCRHKFIDENLLYQISYNKSAFLSNWADQQIRAINFVNSFEIKSKNRGE